MFRLTKTPFAILVFLAGSGGNARREARAGFGFGGIGCPGAEVERGSRLCFFRFGDRSAAEIMSVAPRLEETGLCGIDVDVGGVEELGGAF